MADISLLIKLGRRLRRLRKKKDTKKAVRYGGISRSNKDKRDKEVTREQKDVANKRQTDGGYSDLYKYQKREKVPELENINHLCRKLYF